MELRGLGNIGLAHAVNPRLVLAALAGVTVLRLVVAAIVPLSPDEAYYGLWSQHLRWGYYDDAPLIALWIRVGTAIAGPSAVGIRLLSPFGALLGSLLLWRAANDLAADRRAGPAAAVILNATIMLNAGAVITTPDTPLLLFWTATLAAIGRLHATSDHRWWLAAGLAGGLAIESKYTGVLVFAAIGLWLLLARDRRAWLATIWPWAGLAVGLLVTTPLILWNATHHWAGFLKQGSRTAHFDPTQTFSHLLGLIGGQIGLATPLIALLMAIGLWAAFRKSAAGLQLVGLSVLIPAAVFVEHTLSGAVQANWPAILYPGAAIAAAALAPSILQWLLAPAIGLGVLMSGVVYVQAAAAPISLPGRLDPTARQLAGWDRFAATVSSIARAQNLTLVASTDYGTVAELAHRLPATDTVAGIGSRWSHFDLPSHPVAPAGLLVTPGGRVAPAAALALHAKLIATIARNRGDYVVAHYDIYRIEPGASAPVTIIRPGQ